MDKAEMKKIKFFMKNMTLSPLPRVISRKRFWI